MENKATIDWRDMPDANGFTHWQYENARKEGIELKAPVQGEQEMTITAIPKNKKLVEARDKLDRSQTVDVGNNTNFAIGDEIKVGPHESGYSDVWQLLSGVPSNKRRPTE